MSRKNCGEFMEFFLKCLNPFQIHTSFQLDLFLEFIIKKPGWNLELGQWTNLFLLNLSVTLQSLESSGLHELVFCIFKVWMIGNCFWIIEKSAEWLIGPGP
jgi:hypothetical protein